MEIVFWLSILIIFYVYFGYPAIIYLTSLFYKKPNRTKYHYLEVSLIISVYNEGNNIENKIKNLMDLDYPKDKLEILIGSDGSTDNTEDIMSKYKNSKIKIFSKAKREGKPSMLNMLASEAKGEILVFSDARQQLEKDSLKELVKNFAVKEIGSVSSELFFEREKNKTVGGINLYWKYEKFIRSHESKIGSMLGATGAMYAIRRELFSKLPKDLILDDVYIPLKIVQKGYRAIFEPKAKIYDKAAKNVSSEFLRKTRTLAGNFQVFCYLKGLFNPFKSPIAFQLFSHKFLRLFVPFLLIATFISNVLILNSYCYIFILAMQIIFYTFAFLGFIFKRKNYIFAIPSFFCVMNSAAVIGLYRFLTNKQEVLWQKAERTS